MMELYCAMQIAARASERMASTSLGNGKGLAAVICPSPEKTGRVRSGAPWPESFHVAIERAQDGRRSGERASRATSPRPALALFLEKTRELGFDPLMIESFALGQLSARHHHIDQPLDIDIAQRQAIHVDAILAASSNAGLTAGGGAARRDSCMCADRGDRRVDAIGDLAQPSLALLRRDRRGGDREASECGIGEGEHRPNI